eukprot:1752497-Prymnesium_polylepis.1
MHARAMHARSDRRVSAGRLGSGLHARLHAHPIAWAKRSTLLLTWSSSLLHVFDHSPSAST